MVLSPLVGRGAVRIGLAALWSILVVSNGLAASVIEPLRHVREWPGAAARDVARRRRLFAVNTPDNRLEIFDIGVGTLTHVASVPVGLEPVAVAARSNTEVWVVNHLSDSVSVVDVTAPRPRGGADAAGRRRAARHRLRRPGRQPRLHHDGPSRPEHAAPCHHRDRPRRPPGIGRADVWVFDATALGAHARRHARYHRDAVRRHAARARGLAGRQHRLRGRLPLRQSHDDARVVCDGVGAPERSARAPGGLPGAEHQLRTGMPGARGRPDRQVRRRQHGSTSSAAAGTAR